MPNIAMLSCAHIHTKGYCQDIAKLDGCALVAVWDDVADRGRRYAQEFGSEFVADLDAVLGRDDVDGFIICAENTRHLPLLAAAVPVGKPIFCEKPFTTTVADAAEAMALIRRHGTVVHMGYVQPFRPYMQAATKLIADGALGELTHARFRNAHHAAYGRWFDSADLAWFTDPALAGGGAFMDMGTHAVHAMRSLLGPVARVAATIGNKCGAYPQVDDYGIALLEFAGGVTGTVEAAWVQTGGVGGLEVVGSKATLFNHPQLGYVTAAPKQDPQPLPEAPARPDRVGRLVAAIRGELTNDELDADLTCAADAVAILQACYASSDAGAWVDMHKV